MMRRYFIPLFFIVLGMVSCDRTRSSTGWDYMPDMYYSNAYESYTPNENFSDGLTMRTPVKGSVPRDMVPFPYEKSDEDRLLAGKQLINPLEMNETNLVRGEEAYGIFCVNCHGDLGDGQGYLFTSLKYPYPPASLVNDKMKQLSDGEIFHAITLGYGVMGAHGAMITQDDRWKIIQYIRAELQQ